MQDIVLHCMGGFGSQDLGRLDGCFQDDYVRHVTPGLTGVNSFAEHVADLKRRHQSLSNARFELAEIFTDGEVVVARFAFAGRHTGLFLGLPPTQKLLRRAQICFFHFRDGRIEANYSYVDMNGMLRALSAPDVLPEGSEVPAPALAVAQVSPQQTERNKAAVNALFEEGFNAGNFAFVREALAPEFAAFGWSESGDVLDAAAYSLSLERLSRILAGAQTSIEEIRAYGASVAIRCKVTGRNNATFLGLPPTGVPVSLHIAAIFHFEGDRIRDSHAVVDFWGTAWQLRKPA